MSGEKLDVGITDTAAVAVWGSTRYIFHQGKGSNGWLWYLTNGTLGWTRDSEVGNTGMSFSPGACVLNDEIYVFHQGRGENGQLWYNKRYSGGSWSGDRLIAERCLSRSPRSVVYRGRIYLFYQGSDLDGKLRYRVITGNDVGYEQTVQNTKITESPSPVVYRDKIFVFYQGKDQDHDKVLHWTEYDGNKWSGDITHRAWAWVDERLAAPPCAVVARDRIWIFFFSGMTLNGGGEICYRTMYPNGDWDTWRQSIGKVGAWWNEWPPKSLGPCVVADGDTFHAYGTAQNGFLYYKSFKP